MFSINRAGFATALILLALGISSELPGRASDATQPAISMEEVSLWSGTQAMNDIGTQLSFGVRSINTPGHERVVDFIKSELAKTPALVLTQPGVFLGTDAKIHPLTNIIGRFDPDNPTRIIVGTHYDSIVRAYADPLKPNAPMPGANNSASGVAVLLETIRVLSSIKQRPAIGIDFVFFDGEEGPLALGAGDPHWKALGSPYFVSRLNNIYPASKPVASVIFDMVCYDKQTLHPELLSLRFARTEVERFWSIGHKLAPSVFDLTPTRSEISDDHTALSQAGIPSFLVIGFEYDPWFNTTMDTLDKCSASSLEAVGQTLMYYLFSVAK